MMTAKYKAYKMYQYARELHGEELAKEEALKSALATKALAPPLHKDYWDKVVEHLSTKENDKW